MGRFILYNSNSYRSLTCSRWKGIGQMLRQILGHWVKNFADLS